MMQFSCRLRQGLRFSVQCFCCKQGTRCVLRWPIRLLVVEGEHPGNSLETNTGFQAPIWALAALQTCVRVPGPWREQEQAFINAKVV